MNDEILIDALKTGISILKKLEKIPKCSCLMRDKIKSVKPLKNEVINKFKN